MPRWIHFSLLAIWLASVASMVYFIGTSSAVSRHLSFALWRPLWVAMLGQNIVSMVACVRGAYPEKRLSIDALNFVVAACIVAITLIPISLNFTMFKMALGCAAAAGLMIYIAIWRLSKTARIRAIFVRLAHPSITENPWVG